MTQFLIRRLFWAIFLFFVATIITYLIFWVIPSDPAALAAGKSATPADIARVRHFLHLDERSASLDPLSLGGKNCGDPAGHTRPEVVLHLHRLDYHQHRSGLNHITDRCLDLVHRASNW